MPEGIAKSESKTELRFETIGSPWGNEITCCPERGGIIVSIRFQGKEILYLDENTLRDVGVNVKGGVPVLFPNAGPIPEELKNGELAKLEQHGFARKAEWRSVRTTNGIDIVLKSNDESIKMYPYNFILSLINKLNEDGSLTIREQVQSFETEKNMPVSFGLHPYFKVPTELKRNIEFNFAGGDFVKANTEKWANGEAVKIDNPGVPMEVVIPELGKLIFTISPEYKRVWVWSQSGKDFICIEPVMRDAGRIVLDPEMIKPNQKYSASFNIRLISDQT